MTGQFKLDERARARIAGLIAALALGLSLLVLLFGTYEPGLRLAADDTGLYVAEVEPFGQAARDGVNEGMRVLSLNGQQLIRLPQYAYPEQDPDHPDVAGEPTPIGPAVPTPVTLPADELDRLARGRIDSADLIKPSQLASWSPDDQCCPIGVYYPGSLSLTDASFALLPGLALLLLGIWWLDTGRGGESLRSIALPAAAAAATPLLVRPMMATMSPELVIVAGLVTVVAMIPLALGLAERIDDDHDRRLILLAIAMLSVVGAVSVIFVVTSNAFRTDVELLRWASIGAIPLVPGLAAAGPLDLGGLRVAGITSGRLMQSTELAIAGATPLFALATDRPPFLWPIALWLGAIAVAGRFTVRPLARLVTRAQLQRDLIVAATEAERARLAADIHDEALQELTLLVRRLETAGDTEGAELGRTVADRLRAICGDLRLPILDDLGVGPALDWLVLRIERLAGGEVRLERTDGTRPPPDVELAIFRVAQEALANAVKHGSPPIVVRYRATDSGVSLSIDDAGPGIAANAGTAAEQGGHFGLLNMQQRAEAIGAILDIRRWPSGGTHVALEWRQR
jgi:signal transduction histidine kinase